MAGPSLRRGCVSGFFTSGAIIALALVGAGCSSSSDGDGGGQLLVRTASGGAMDLSGTAWSQCYANEPSAGMSRRTTMAFGDGTFTITSFIFTASVNCTGPTDPAQGLDATAQTDAQGDREVGWDDGPPTGLAAKVTATAVLLSGFTPGSGMPDPMKTLFFVNDLASPKTQHMGGKAGVAPDGYPTTLESWGRERVAP